jgi:hypothetical protein
VVEETEAVHPVELLALDYHEDLKALKKFSLSIITESDIAKLQVLCSKYKYNVTVTKDNFASVLGSLSARILDKFEELAITHVLERERLEKPEKMPKERIEEVETIPVSLLEDEELEEKKDEEKGGKKWRRNLRRK